MVGNDNLVEERSWWDRFDLEGIEAITTAPLVVTVDVLGEMMLHCLFEFLLLCLCWASVIFSFSLQLQERFVYMRNCGVIVDTELFS